LQNPQEKRRRRRLHRRLVMIRCSRKSLALNPNFLKSYSSLRAFSSPTPCDFPTTSSVDHTRGFHEATRSPLPILGFKKGGPLSLLLAAKAPYPSCNFLRSYCSENIGRDGVKSSEWTEEIEYLDESGGVIYTGKGVRSVEPGLDDHVMIGDIRKPLHNISAVAKIVEVVKRWKWGPELETQLDKLQFVPNTTHIVQALKVINESDASLSLFRWAKRQPWYVPNDECYLMLFDGLNQNRDFDGIQQLFDEMVSGKGIAASATAYNRVIQYLAKAEKLE
ncbi:hypothetical protein CRG98_014052, partial [Punica granatum]